MNDGKGEKSNPDAMRDEQLLIDFVLGRCDEAAAERMAGECAEDQAALALARCFERDTLILMQEMRALVTEKDRAIVDELADEERAHLVTLTEAGEKLGR